MTNQTEDYTAWIGHDVIDRAGDKVGKVSNIFLDDESGQPEWLTVSTGVFAKRSSFVPLEGATSAGDQLVIGWDKDMVKNAPQVDDDGDGHLTPTEEQELYRYYGRSTPTTYETATDDVADTRPATGTGPAQTGDEAMTRSEEQVHVGTRSQEAGRVRLRKYVVTENVTQTVPVSHEEVRVEREAITDANRDQAMTGAEITEAEHEVTLHAETPVVEKEVVPVERVRLAKETVTNQETVNTDVRKERIEEEGTDVTT
jgi:uncharacterized protein (TIGR02271 family)